MIKSDICYVKKITYSIPVAENKAFPNVRINVTYVKANPFDVTGSINIIIILSVSQIICLTHNICIEVGHLSSDKIFVVVGNYLGRIDL